MFNNIMGIITFKGCGDNTQIFINRIKDNRIKCFDVKIINGCVFGNIYNKDYSKVTDVANDLNIDISIEQKSGFVYKTIRYRKRYGIYLGIIFAIAMVIYLSNVVLEIDIIGNKTIEKEMILNVLKDNNVSVGRLIPVLDFDQLERILTLELENVSYVSVRNVGSRIAIEIDEMVVAPYVIPQHVPCNVVASRDAQIVGLRVYLGMIVPMIGDGVKKGDVLISGIFTDKHDVSSISHAMGNITGRYTEKMVFNQNFIQEQTILLGEKIHRKSISMFGARIPLYLAKYDYTQYEYSQNISEISFFNISLPIGIIHEEYQLHENRNITYTQESAQIQIEEKMSKFESEFFNNERIVSREIQKNLYGSNIEWVVNYTLEGEIGSMQEIIVKKTN